MRDVMMCLETGGVATPYKREIRRDTTVHKDVQVYNHGEHFVDTTIQERSLGDNQ